MCGINTSITVNYHMHISLWGLYSLTYCSSSPAQSRQHSLRFQVNSGCKLVTTFYSSFLEGGKIDAIVPCSYIRLFSLVLKIESCIFSKPSIQPVVLLSSLLHWPSERKPFLYSISCSSLPIWLFCQWIQGIKHHQQPYMLQVCFGD